MVSANCFRDSSLIRFTSRERSIHLSNARPEYAPMTVVIALVRPPRPVLIIESAEFMRAVFDCIWPVSGDISERNCSVSATTRATNAPMSSAICPPHPREVFFQLQREEVRCPAVSGGEPQSLRGPPPEATLG